MQQFNKKVPKINDFKHFSYFEFHPVCTEPFWFGCILTKWT